MDPTLDPDFVPPSKRTVPLSFHRSPSYFIPNTAPIQPLVLEEVVGSSVLDTPLDDFQVRRSSMNHDTPSHGFHGVNNDIPTDIPRIDGFSSDVQDEATASVQSLTVQDATAQEPVPGLAQGDQGPQASHVAHSTVTGPVPVIGPAFESLSSLVSDPARGQDADSSALATARTGHDRQKPGGPSESKAPTSTSSPSTTPPSSLSPVNGRSGSNIPNVNSADLEEVPAGVVRQATELKNYSFPDHRLATALSDDSKLPLVLVACGSFSPITYLHLRMFEMAMDTIRENTRFEVIGGFYSPVSDNYKKAGLAPAYHRVRMCELACERTSSWLMVDSWESLQPTYQRTALVLDHFNHEINVVRKGVATSSGRRRGVKIMLLAGGDLIESMGEPNVWAEEDLHHILGRYGCLIVERTGSDVRSFLLSHDIMYEHRRNVMIIKQLIYNDISSTKVRLFIRRGMSVQYLLPNSVIRYILENGLYYESEPVKQVMAEKD